DGGASQVVFQRSPAGADTWTTIATDASAPFAASLDTTGLADGSYDLRAVASDQAGNESTSTLRTIRVDNTKPTGSLTAPAGGASVSGATALTATAADTGSGVASVTFQYRVAGGGTYTDAATDTSSPYESSWTPPLAGSFELRLRVADRAGNVLETVPVTVNGGSGSTSGSGAATVSLADPGSSLSGTVTLSAAATGA